MNVEWEIYLRLLTPHYSLLPTLAKNCHDSTLFSLKKNLFPELALRQRPNITRPDHGRQSYGQPQPLEAWSSQLNRYSSTCRNQCPECLYRNLLCRSLTPRSAFGKDRLAAGSCSWFTTHLCILLIQQKAHPKYIQEQLGHGSIKVAMDIYGHLFEGDYQLLSAA